MARKWVFRFQEGRADQRELLGGKGANLAEMTNLGLPVPPGFTVSTEACNAYIAQGGSVPEGLWDQVVAAMKQLEGERRFGDPERPLLVSVRSGARFSMPGMMDTVLNLGLNRQTVKGLAESTGDARFALDSLRRLIQIFGSVVLGISSSSFSAALEHACDEAGVVDDGSLTPESLEQLVERYLVIVREATGEEFPEDPYEQLRRAICAVFGSWDGRRARDYRRIHHIADDLGTAVNIQTMVFGNMGADSGTGVAFTRNPSTGDPGLYGEYLLNAQGEDVVAGIRTPSHIQRLKDEMPAAYEEFLGHARNLENHFLDMQDIEFTIEKGHLYILQTRTGKRTSAAAVKIAVDMVGERLISREEAVARVDAGSLEQLLHPIIDPSAEANLLAAGLPASPGAASGMIVLDPDEAEHLEREGKRTILVRTETAPEDFHGMVAAAGILTSRGGMTSHAAVVARGMGKCCVCGAGDVKVDYAAETVTAGKMLLKKGDWITLNGSTGEVFAGELPTLEPELGGDFDTLMSWADEFRTARVRTNADSPEGAEQGRRFGAEGIGLCRTEHMFFEGDRIRAMQEMILADTPEERETALAKLEPLQQADFLGIFRAMNGYPVTIRTLDPPLHEFLPREAEDIKKLAESLGLSDSAVATRIERLREANPMIGFRGCRLGLLYPEITSMQARAIIRAAVAAKRAGIEVLPEIMIPLVSDVAELREQIDLVRSLAESILAEEGIEVPYLLGTMIELPRAALTAAEIAEVAEFFSFGTNDLTQMTYGLSRDDAGTFLPEYLARRIFSQDPFQVLDQRGVGQLVQMAAQAGRKARPGIKLGICGEHGGEPESVKFCLRNGLDYVSCSPSRVPIARLSAAQVALELAAGAGTTARRDV